MLGFPLVDQLGFFLTAAEWKIVVKQHLVHSTFGRLNFDLHGFHGVFSPLQDDFDDVIVFDAHQQKLHAGVALARSRYNHMRCARLLVELVDYRVVFHIEVVSGSG